MVPGKNDLISARTYSKKAQERNDWLNNFTIFVKAAKISSRKTPAPTGICTQTRKLSKETIDEKLVLGKKV